MEGRGIINLEKWADVVYGWPPNEITKFAEHFDVLEKFMLILKICIFVNQIDGLQSSNKKVVMNLMSYVARKQEKAKYSGLTTPQMNLLKSGSWGLAERGGANLKNQHHHKDLYIELSWESLFSRFPSTLQPTRCLFVDTNFHGFIAFLF